MKVDKCTDFDLVCDFLKANFSSPTHWPDWNLVVSKHFNTNFFYYVASDQGEIVGICPVHRVKYKSFLWQEFSGQFHYIPYGGWIFSFSTRERSINLPLNNRTYHRSFSLPLLKEFNGSYMTKPQTFFDTLIVDLQQDIDVIWMNEIDSKRRNMIRKAEKTGIEILETDFPDASFFSIYQESCFKNQLNPLSESFFFDLIRNSQNISISFLTAISLGTPVANVVLVSDKDYSIYWIGSNAGKTSNNGQGDLLQWYAIKRMKEIMCKYYDLCYVEKIRLPEIYKFKKGFSKNEIHIAQSNIKDLSYRILNKLL